MPYFSKKGVYHSWLQRRSPIVLQFTSDVIDSQYKGQSDFIWFRVRGDDDAEATYYYLIENDEIRSKLEGIDQTKWWKVNFQSEEISEGEFNAWVDLEEAGDAPASTGGGQRQTRGRYDVPVNVNLVEKYVESLRAAKEVAANVLEDATNEDVRAIATSLYIAWQNRGYEGDLYGGEPESDSDSGPAKAEPTGVEADLRKQIDKLASKSGKAHDGTNLKTAIGKIEKLIEQGAVPVDKYMTMGLWLRKEHDHQQAAAVGADNDFDDELPF